MEDIKILDAVERYIRGEMNPEERRYFEDLRKSSTEIDQLVVEQTLFLQQLEQVGQRKQFRTALHEVHTGLTEEGKIKAARPAGQSKVVYLWNRYKRVAAIAATIAGITTLGISALVTPKAPTAEIEKLKGIINVVEKKTDEVGREIKDVKNKVVAPHSLPNVVYTTGGTGFIIDAKGFLVTNAHVVDKAKNIAVQNNKGEFVAKVVYLDASKDIAILKIEDDNFKPYTSIPYAISKSPGRLAEPIFTLGYPRTDAVVYGQGYLSAKTGFNGDTLSCQIDIAANRGNSGSPIINSNGEVIGILTEHQTNAQGFAFAIQGKHIYKVLDELKKDTSYQRLKLTSKSSMSGMDRPSQVEKMEDYVYMVKVNN